MSLTDHHGDHDDFGGLHRDLLATGRRVGRRRLLRLAGGIGASFSALQLMGCGGNDSPTAPSTGTSTGTCLLYTSPSPRDS